MEYGDAGAADDENSRNRRLLFMILLLRAEFIELFSRLSELRAANDMLPARNHFVLGIFSHLFLCRHL